MGARARDPPPSDDHRDVMKVSLCALPCYAPFVIIKLGFEQARPFVFDKDMLNGAHNDNLLLLLLYNNFGCTGDIE